MAIGSLQCGHVITFCPSPPGLTLRGLAGKNAGVIARARADNASRMEVLFTDCVPFTAPPGLQRAVRSPAGLSSPLPARRRPGLSLRENGIAPVVRPRCGRLDSVLPGR